MSNANPLVTPSAPAPRPAPIPNGHAVYSHAEQHTTANCPTHSHDTRPAPAPPGAASAAPSKGKQKKAMNSNEASKLVAARISQLELDAAGEKDQEADIDREVKKAHREMNNQTSKMSDLQKIDHLTKRCSEFLAELKRHERESIKHKKRADQLQKEKDASRTELSRTVGLKEKLEKLCRELQKENNKLKNENKTMSDLQVRNQSSWDEKYATILQKLSDYQDEKDNPKKQVVDVEVDELFRQRLRTSLEQYELRELQFHSLMRTKELEVQYNLARFEREKKNGEALNTQVQTFSRTENDLRQQLNVYVDKFKQVEDTLNNSNDLFLTFRKEMQEMGRKTRKLEKQNKKLRRRQKGGDSNGDVSDEMSADEKTRYEGEIEALRKKEATLMNIIKQMQQQGRGLPAATSAGAAVVNGYVGAEGELDRGESEYDYEGDEDLDEEEGSDDGDEYDDETEDESQPEPRAYGPERPPPPPIAAINGHS